MGHEDTKMLKEFNLKKTQVCYLFNVKTCKSLVCQIRKRLTTPNLFIDSAQYFIQNIEIDLINNEIQSIQPSPSMVKVSFSNRTNREVYESRSARLIEINDI